MSKTSEKNEGPMCSCGRPDLYEESLKLKEKTEVNDSTVADKTGENNCSVDTTENKGQK